MRTIAVLWLILLLFLGGCGDSGPNLQPLADQAVILAFGDSITYGTGASKEQSYPAVLEKLSGHKVINAGVPGELSADGLNRLPKLLETYQPALVILTHGGNDLLRKMQRETIRQNLAAMIELIRQQQAQVVLVAVPRPSLLLSADPLYEQVAQFLQVPLVKESLPEILQSRQSKSDAIHPNANGYAQLARDIFQFLQDRQAL